MGYAFDTCPDRPENIDAILNGLDRYNPETTGIFQDYIAQQCESQTYDCFANLALLKLYVRIASHIHGHMMIKSHTRFLLPDRTRLNPGRDAVSLILALSDNQHQHA